MKMQRKGNNTTGWHVAMMAAVLLLAGCAKQGFPSGGPKDVAPPVVLSTLPDNQSTRFADRQFSIAFDEYVVLKDADNNVLVSPPISPKPTYGTKGKSVVVKLGDSLQANTTYLFQFQEAVADFNEGNLLPSFSYVFSTGDAIDSMEVRGEVLDALTLQPREATISVAAYPAHSETLLVLPDSMAFKTNPAYITRCNKQGQFNLDYMRKGEGYWLVAFEDENKNQRLDAGEAVGFLDTAVSPTCRPHAIDSTADSLALHATPQTPVQRLLMWSVEGSQQRVLNYQMTEKGYATVVTALPMTSPTVDAMGQQVEYRLNDRRDTLQLWMLKPADSLRVVLADTTGINDTLKLRRTAKTGKMHMGAAAAASLKARPCFGDKLPYYESPAFAFSTLLVTEAPRVVGAVLCMDADSTVHPMDLLVDSNGLRATLVADSTFVMAQGKSYRLTLLAGKLTDLWHRSNDSLSVQTTLTEEKDYGNICLRLHNATGSPLLCQLMDDKGNVLRQVSVVGDTLLSYPHLLPATYRIRAVVDTNGNRRWDAGDYPSRRQSERVVYFDKRLEIRANWDFEEAWTIE